MSSLPARSAVVGVHQARRALNREPLDAAACVANLNYRGVLYINAAARPSMPPRGERRRHQREPLDAGDVPCPSTCRAAAPGPMPVGRSTARLSMPARWRAA
jgi:hypothetical protein